jgi:hypothetical protein
MIDINLLLEVENPDNDVQSSPFTCGPRFQLQQMGCKHWASLGLYPDHVIWTLKIC